GVAKEIITLSAFLLGFEKIRAFKKKVVHFGFFHKLFNIYGLAFFHICLFKILLFENNIGIVFFKTFHNILPLNFLSRFLVYALVADAGIIVDVQHVQI